MPGFDAQDPETREAAFLRDVHIQRNAELYAEEKAEQAAQAVRDELTVYDSGWINVPYLAGFSAATVGQLQYRRYGDMVFIRGGAFRTAGDFTTTDMDVATLPEEDPNEMQLRPTVVHRYTNYGTSGRIGRANLSPGGAFNIRVPDNPTLEDVIDVDESGAVHDKTVSMSPDFPFQWLDLSTAYLLG